MLVPVTQSISALPFEVPSSSPAWFCTALVLLSSEPAFGEEWWSLLRLWVKFEAKAGFNNTKLPSRGRPSFLGLWFKNRRSNCYRPDLEHPVEEGMLTWWDVLPRDAVCSSGLNGVLTLLFGLFVWRERIREATAQRDVWVGVVGEKASMQFFNNTALMAFLCCHDVVLFIANMRSAGEKQHYVMVLLETLFQHLPLPYRVGLLYNIGCQTERSCIKWNFLDRYIDRISFGISVFHAFRHQ
ncbi:hypothetical protein DXG01_013655 [Tephrocybe rancida]|nr:hypothetical protein DXG01_013655 [Tephrocybe rancida]